MGLLSRLAEDIRYSQGGIPGMRGVVDVASDARNLCLQVERDVNDGRVLDMDYWHHETLECFRASMVLFAEATNRPLDPNSSRTWAEGLGATYGFVSVDLDKLIQRLFPTPSMQSITSPNSFIVFRDRLKSQLDACERYKQEMKDAGCTP